MKVHITPNEVIFSYGWSKFDPVSPGESFSSLIIYASIKRFRYQRKGMLKISLFYKSSLNEFH